MFFSPFWPPAEPFARTRSVPHVERNIVRQHNDPFGRDLVKRRCSVHRLAGQVHEGLRLEEEHALAAQHPLAHERLELHPVDLLPGARAVAFQRSEARVMAGVVVLAAGLPSPTTSHSAGCAACAAFCSSSFLKISNTDIGSNSKISTSAPGGEILINIASFVMLYLRAVAYRG